jgi:hypothetical protein
MIVELTGKIHAESGIPWCISYIPAVRTGGFETRPYRTRHPPGTDVFTFMAFFNKNNSSIEPLIC